MQQRSRSSVYARVFGCPSDTARVRVFARLALVTLVSCAVSACGAAHAAGHGEREALERRFQDSVCEAPTYAPPWQRDHQVDLVAPAGYMLRDAVLVLDDTSGGRDTALPLLTDFRPEPGVRRTRPPWSTSIERLTFDLPLWKPGRNRFVVRGHVTNGEDEREVESAVAQLDYCVPRALGQGSSPRSYRLPTTHFVRTMQACRGSFCKDRDGDGLNDLWENVALHQLRPRLMLDRGDELFEHAQDGVTVMTSVQPLLRDRVQYVVFASVVAFSRDYGFLIGWDHPGDAETFGMVFRVEADDSLRWVSSVTKGHPCLTCRQSYQRYPQEFAEDGAPLLFVEKNKHGLWQSGRACRSKSPYSCRGDRSLRPEANNVGDHGRGGSRRLVDVFDDTRGDGPFAEVAKLFPGDAVWTASLARVKGKFCGGRNRDCSRSSGATMPGVIIAQLYELFATEKL